jgi:hypothetical protein
MTPPHARFLPTHDRAYASTPRDPRVLPASHRYKEGDLRERVTTDAPSEVDEELERLARSMSLVVVKTAP